MPGPGGRRANHLSRIALVLAGALGALLVAWSGLASPLGDEQPPPAFGEPPPESTGSAGVSPGGTVSGSGVPVGGPTSLFADAANLGAAAATTEPTVVRSRLVEVNLGALGTPNGPPGAAAAPGGEIVLNLFPDVVLTGVLDRIEMVSPPGYVWVGHVKDIDMSSVTLSVQDDVVIGNVRLPEQVYAVRFVGNGVHVVQEIDTSKFLPD